MIPGTGGRAAVPPIRSAARDDLREMLARMADRVHEFGALAGIELAYNGLNDPNLHTREVPMAPTGLPVASFTYDPAQARTMNRQDIRNLEVPAGEFLSVIGPSECGKTTLLNLLAGFYAPEEGEVALRGEPIRPEDPHLGYVFQQPTLFPWLSAVENVEFGLRMAGMREKERRERALHYFHLVGLAGFEDYLVVRLSGGMQQRVNLARALAMEPTLLLMDEPFGALDAITRETMNDELLRIWDSLGQTVLFITHDIDEAIYLSDRIAVLSRPPGGLHRVLGNALPRPRHGPTTRTSERFWDYKKQLIGDIAEVTAQRPTSEEEIALLKRRKTMESSEPAG